MTVHQHTREKETRKKSTKMWSMQGDLLQKCKKMEQKNSLRHNQPCKIKENAQGERERERERERDRERKRDTERGRERVIPGTV